MDMRLRSRRELLLAAGSAALLAPFGAAHAQAYPARSITLIVPWPAGGSTDRHLRTLAEIASKHLGQNILVENKPGGGTLGPGTMAMTARPDGYTLAQLPMGMLRMPHMQKTAWDPLEDFTYILGVTQRWPAVPTAKELGYDIVFASPYGIVGPKGMDPAVVKALHDAFKKAMDDPKHVELLAQLNQDAWYRSGPDYAKWAGETFVRDKALIERLGLAAK